MPQAVDIVLSVDENGTITDRQKAEWLWSQIRFYAGRKVRIRVSAPARSSRANSYYWGAVIEAIWKACLMAGIPTTREALHELFKRRYLQPQTVVSLGGEDITLPPTTTNLNSTEFYQYIENIRNDEEVMALGCYIETPEEWGDINGQIRGGAIAEAA